VRWLKESEHKATLESDKMHLRWLDRFSGGRHLDEISRALVDRITDARVAEGVSNATVNRTLEVARAILRKALNDWEWLDRVPPRIRMLKEPTRRVRFPSREEADRLLAALPEHLAEMARFSLATGLRRGNVTGLQCTQVDLVRRCAWIHPDQAKARKAIAVPLNAEAVLILRRQGGKHPTHVFSFTGSRSVRSVQRRGAPLSSGPGARTFAGTICGTAGRAGTYSKGRRCTHYRSLGAGRVRRWYVVMRICRRSTWRPMRIAYAPRGLWSRSTAQICHRWPTTVRQALLSRCRNWRARRDSNSRPPGS